MNKERFEALCGIIYFGFIHVLAIVGAVALIANSLNQTTRPVEDINKIDSIVAVNDSIKIVVDHLDSVKNAKIIEVSVLDNDSTVKLFYELLAD